MGKEKSETEIFAEIKKMIEDLPRFEQKAVMWIIQNMNIAELLCDPDDPYSEEKLRQEMQKARETRDYVYLALLMYQKTVQEREQEKRP